MPKLENDIPIKVTNNIPYLVKRQTAAYSEKITLFLKKRVFKMKRGSAAVFSPTQQTPAVSKPRLTIEDVTLIDQRRQSNRLTTQRESGQNSNPYNRGPGDDIVQMSRGGDGYMDSTQAMDIGTPGPVPTVRGPDNGNTGAGPGHVTSDTAGQTSSRSSLAHMTMVDQPGGSGVQGISDSDRERIEVLTEKQSDTWLTKTCKGVLKFAMLQSVSTGPGDNDSYIVDPNIENYMTAFNEGYTNETRAIALSHNVVMSDSVRPGPGQEWWRPLAQILGLHDLTQADKEQLQILFCSPQVSRIMLSLSRLNKNLSDTDPVLMTAKNKSSNNEQLVTIKLICCAIATGFEQCDKLCELATQFQQEWNNCNHHVTTAAAQLISNTVDQGQPVTRQTLNSVVSKLNTMLRDLHKKFVKLTKESYLSATDVNFNKRLNVFADILGLQILLVTGESVAQDIIADSINQHDSVIYFCEDEQIFFEISSFKHLKQQIDQIKAVKIRPPPNPGHNVVVSLEPETMNMLGNLSLYPGNTAPFASSGGGQPRVTTPGHSTTQTNVDDDTRKKQLAISKVLLERRVEIGSLSDTLSAESMGMDELQSAKASAEQLAQEMKDFGFNLSVTKDVKNCEINEFPVSYIDQVEADGVTHDIRHQTTIGKLISRLSTDVREILAKISLKVDEKKKEQEEVKATIKKLIPDIQIVKCGPGQEHLVLNMLDGFFTRYYDATKNDFIPINEPRPVIEDMKQHATPNLKLLMSGCSNLGDLADCIQSYITEENKWVLAFISFMRKERRTQEGSRNKRDLYQENQLVISFYSTILDHFRLMKKYGYLFKTTANYIGITADNIAQMEAAAVLELHRQDYFTKSYHFKTQNPAARRSNVLDMTSRDSSDLNSSRLISETLSNNRTIVTEPEFGTAIRDNRQLRMANVKRLPSSSSPWERLIYLIYYLERKMKEAQSTAVTIRRGETGDLGRTGTYGSGRFISRGANHATMEPDEEMTNNEVYDDMDMNSLSMNAASRRNRKLFNGNAPKFGPPNTGPPPGRASFSQSELQDCKAVVKDGKLMLVGKCPLKDSCSDYHIYGSLYYCPTFGDWSPAERRAALKRNNICNRCIRAHADSSSKCPADRACPRCGGPHHSMVCPADNTRSVNMASVDQHSPAVEETGNTPDNEQMRLLIDKYEKVIKHTPLPNDTYTKLKNKDPTRLYTYSHSTDPEDDIESDNNVQMNMATGFSAEQVQNDHLLNSTSPNICIAPTGSPETPRNVAMKNVSMKMTTLTIPEEDLFYNISESENEFEDKILLSHDHPKYNSFASLSYALNQKYSKPLLNFCWVRVLVGQSTDYDYYHKKLSHLPSVTVSIFHGYTVVITRALLDTGCEKSAMLGVLRSKLHLPQLRHETYTLSTPGGGTPINDTIQVLSLIDNCGRVWSTEVYHLPNLNEQFGWTPQMSRIAAADLNITVSELEYLVHVQHGTTKPYLILGNSNNFSNTYPVRDLRKIGLKNNFIFNQDMKISYSPISINPYIISGSFGLQNLNVSGHGGPVITLDSNMSDTTIKISAKKILSYLSEVSYSDSDHLYMNYSNIGEELVWVPPTDGRLIQINTGTRVLISKADCAHLSNFIISETSLMDPTAYCQTHQKMFDSTVRDCDECIAASNNINVQGQSVLYKHIWDKLSASPNKDGTFTLTQELVFLHHPRDLGHLSRQNLREARRASVRLVKKLEADGNLKAVDQQIQDRVNNGEMAVLTVNEINKLMTGEISGNFVRRGVTIKPESTTTRVRILDDTSIPIRGLGTSLSDSQRAPRVGVTNLAGMVLRFFCVRHAAQSDISKAYIQTRVTEEDSYLFMSVWFTDVLESSTKYPVIMRARTTIFGQGNANTSLRVGVEKFVKPALTLEVARDQLLTDLYVDNFQHMARSPQELADIMEDVATASAKYGFKISKFFIPHWLTKTEPIKKFLEKRNYIMGNDTIALGLEINLVEDTVRPFWKLSVFKSTKGVLSGPKLAEATVLPENCSRRTSARVLCQLYDVSGRFGSPVISSAKLLHSNICKVVSHSDLDKKVCLVNMELAVNWADFWNNVAAHKIDWFPRCVVSEGFEITSFIFSHDANHSIYSTTAHVITSNGTTTESHVLAGKSHVSESTTPKNEQRSTCHSVILAHETLLSLKTTIKHQKTTPEIIFVGDSMIASFLFKGETNSRCMLARSLRMKCDSYLSSLTTVFPDMEFYFVWTPSKYLVADKLTKFDVNPIKIVNSAFYKEGPELYRQEQLKYFCYYYATGSIKQFSQLPPFNKTKPGDLFEEVVVNNPHVSAKLTQTERSDVTMSESQMFHLARSLYHDTTIPQLWGDTSHLSRPVTELEFNNMNLQISNNKQQFSIQQSCDDDDGHEEEIENEEDETNRTIYQELYDFDDLSSMSQLSALMVMAKHSSESHVVNISNAQITQNDPDMIYDCDRFYRMDLRGFQNNIAIFDGKLFILNKNIYTKLINSHSNLLTILNKFHNVIRFVMICRARSEMKKDCQVNLPTPAEIKCATWRSLVASDQKHFPCKLKNSDTKMANGIYLALSRRENIILPVLDTLSPLLTRLIWTIHLETSSASPGVPTIHHCYKTVTGTLSSCALGVYCENLNGIVTRTLRYCAVCTKVDLTFYKTLYGNAFKHSRGGMRVMSEVSCDPLGPMRVKAHSKSRNNNVIVYGLLAVCKLSGVTDLVIIESTAAQSVVRGLKMIEYRLNTNIRTLYVDKGTSLSEKLITESGKLSWKVVQFEGKAQNRSLSESRLVVLKRYWRKLFHQYRGEDHCYSLQVTVIDLQFIFEMLILAVNLIPVNQGSYYSPAFCRYPPALLQNLEKDENTDGFESAFLGKYSEFFNEIMKIRDENLAHLLNDDMKHKYHHQKGKMDSRKPSCGDIVALPGKPRPTLARIENIDSDHTVTLYTGKRSFQAPVKELLLIQPHMGDPTCQSEPDHPDTEQSADQGDPPCQPEPDHPDTEQSADQSCAARDTYTQDCEHLQ